jgi:D-alanyl-D-alanine carboxypeptidase
MNSNKSKINKKKIVLTRHFLLAAFLCSVSIFGACRAREESRLPEISQSSDETSSDSGAATFEIPAPSLDLAKPFEISRAPKDVALCEKINQTIEQSEFANARWGVFLISLKDGRAVCERDGRKLFNPASIEKTLTALVALDKLGADFHFKTSVFTANQIESDGTLNGDLTIY